MGRSVIVLEFNELTPQLMNDFIAQGLLPGFKRLRDEAVVAVSDAQEAPPYLEPWIQWVTVHTGLSFAEHKVLNLSDGPKLDAPRIWDMVSDAGKDVWVCGSMNAAVQDENLRGMVVPDPWAVGVEPKPRGQFEPYFHLVRNYVQQYTSEKSPVTKADFFRFAMFMSANGLSPKTVIAALRQLSSEGGGKSRWRRAAILDRLQWDMFRSNYRRLKPALSTFFLNSTAHYQHYYWRDHAPELFANKPSEDHLADHKDALRFGYQKMDEIVQECLDLAGPETSIVLCTALSQQPMFKYEEIGGKQVFKPHDIAALMALAGVSDPFKPVPVMAEQFQLHFDSETSAERAAKQLQALALDNGERLMSVRRDGAHLFAGCALIRPPADDAMILTPPSNAAVRFDAYFYPLEGPKSGMHHPEGILWIRTPERVHVEVKRKVSLQEIAPTLLDLCDVTAPVHFAYPPMPEVASIAERREAA